MKRLLVVGGDRRMQFLAELLKQEGYQVETLGLHRQEAVHIDQADAVLLPYPFSVRNGLVPAMDDSAINPGKLLEKVKKEAVIIAEKGLETQDFPNLKRYTDAAKLERRNAELSAEAAVFEAMLHSDLALIDARILVTGYGLFGRALALRLKALGAEVWVAARRRAQREEAEAEGMHTVSILEMETVLPQMNLVLNTIPARIFSEYHLKSVPKDCWLLELASAPYGFDAELCRQMGLNCVQLPGLPGRYSPLSAARALRNAVCELLEGGRA